MLGLFEYFWPPPDWPAGATGGAVGHGYGIRNPKTTSFPMGITNAVILLWLGLKLYFSR